jgi:hypothetical protein
LTVQACAASRQHLTVLSGLPEAFQSYTAKCSFTAQGLPWAAANRAVVELLCCSCLISSEMWRHSAPGVLFEFKRVVSALLQQAPYMPLLRVQMTHLVILYVAGKDLEPISMVGAGAAARGATI